MSDESTGLALREHLEHVLAAVQPDPMFVDSVRAQHRRQVRRRQAFAAAASALAVAAVSAAAWWIGSAAGSGKTPAPTPLASESSTPTPAGYGPAQPMESWFTGSYPLPRPTNGIAQLPLHSYAIDSPGSKRSVLVWYSADTESYCAHSIVQTPEHPEGYEGESSTGGCSDDAKGVRLGAGAVSSAQACGSESWSFVFGVLGADADRVTAEGLGGPDPKIAVRKLDGWRYGVFVALDVKAPGVLFHFFNAAGHEFRHQQIGSASPPSLPTRCGAFIAPPPA